VIDATLASLFYYPRKLHRIWYAPATFIPQINLSKKTQFTLMRIPKKTRLIYLSRIRLWSPLRAYAYILRCEKYLLALIFGMATGD